MSSTQIFLQNSVNGPLIKQETALKLASILLAERWPSEASRQFPLEIKDSGNAWRIAGKENSSPEKSGRFYILIRKDNGMIEDIGMFVGDGGVPD